SYTDSLSSSGAVIARGTINVGGSIVFGGTGDITLADTTVLNAGVSTLGGNGSITILAPIDGAHDLTLSANGDFILLSSDIGLNVRIGILSIGSFSNLDAQKIQAGSLIQTSSLGTSHFHDTIDVDSVDGVSLIGSDFIFDNTLNASGGPVTITNSGSLTFNTG